MDNIELNAFSELSVELRIPEGTLEDAIGDQWALQRDQRSLDLLFLRPVFEETQSETDAYLGVNIIFDIGIRIEASSRSIEVGPLTGDWGTGGMRHYRIKKVVAHLELGHHLPFELANALGRAEQLWESKLKTCRFCKKKFSPDEMVEKDCCFACGSEHLGIIY